MEKVKTTGYKSGRLIQCAPDDSCPLESYCEFWNQSGERCKWPDKQDEAENEGMEIPW